MAHDAHDAHQHERDHTHDHSNEHSPKQSHEHGTGLADLLGLDAEVLGPYLDEVTEWAARHAPADPRRIVDLGAGTGTGTRALARRFTAAQLVAVDRSAEMVERLRAVAAGPDVSGRIAVVEADLDLAWPKVGAVDVAWAASSLHELADPDRVLREAFAALNPGGVLVVVEMDALPRFLPDDLGFGRPGLEPRLHEALDRAGWNTHPDWQPALERAGFEIAGRRTFTLDVIPAPESAGRYASAFLGRAQHALDGEPTPEGRLAPDDLDTLVRLLATDGPDSLLHRRDLSVRGTRTAWVARRPRSASARKAVTAADEPFSAAMEAQVTTRVLGEARHGLDSLF